MRNCVIDFRVPSHELGHVSQIPSNARYKKVDHVDGVCFYCNDCDKLNRRIVDCEGFFVVETHHLQVN